MSKLDADTNLAKGTQRAAAGGQVNDVCVRPASKADASEVAVLVNIATHGLFADLWGRESSEPAAFNSVEVGRRKVLDEGELSWRHASLAEHDGETIGLVLGYPEPAAPPMLAADPYADLAAQTGGGWHISKVAVHAHWRGRGVASRLLEAAEERRQQAGERRLFLIVPDSFTEARQVYEKHGFRVRDKRPIIVPSSAVDLGAKDWILMIKD